MSAPVDRLERLLGGAALSSLRVRLRRRFERGATTDSFSLDNLSATERQALEVLLGRRARLASSMTLSLSEIDAALTRAGLADCLRQALEQLDGPIRELAAERDATASRWENVLGVEVDARLAPLLHDSAGRGLVKRLAGGDPQRGESLIADASRVMGYLPGGGIPLPHLAAKALGDSHALDDGRRVATLLMAALRAAGDERSRETWARWGVLVGELASPALVFNLPAAEDSPSGRLLRECREMAQPVHLSLRLLARSAPRWAVEGRRVFVCENPSIVAMAADRLGCNCAPILSTDGMPAAAQRTLLGQLAASGARLLYHGDFDWPGIGIGNQVMRTHGAVPWKFGSQDYRPESGFPLVGAPVPAEWDPSLAPRMSSIGRGQHEEAVIEELLTDLSG